MNILGINWKTTLAGLVVVIGLGGKLIVALKTKDFTNAGAILQELIPDIMLLAAGLGLIKAKDQNVTGAGPNAVNVDTGKTSAEVNG